MSKVKRAFQKLFGGKKKNADVGMDGRADSGGELDYAAIPGVAARIEEVRWWVNNGAGKK